jgi:hypothetical protein
MRSAVLRAVGIVIVFSWVVTLRIQKMKAAVCSETLVPSGKPPGDTNLKLRNYYIIINGEK